MKSVSCLSICTSTLETAVQNFWNIEKIPRTIHQFKEDIICEEHFVKTHQRENLGHYIVHLPFKKSPPVINNSYQLAIKRFQWIKRILVKQPNIYSMYKDFTLDYENWKHVEIVKPGERQPQVYLPHHHVFRLVNITTKLRVVFDESSTMYSDSSLNDLLYCGTKL